jgi:predicted RNase H-like nuclease (RuvC/YqgF family)
MYGSLQEYSGEGGNLVAFPLRRISAICFLIALLLLFVSCKTTGGAVEPSRTILEYREIQDDIQQRQSDLAVTGVKIETETQGLVEGIVELEKEMIAAPPEEAARWVPQVQSIREEAETLQEDVNTLNLLLSAERESYSDLNNKFNEYEAMQNKIIVDKEKEITTLRVDNKKISGQRNVLLAIIITAVVVIVLVIGIKVLRLKKIIPW